MVSGGATRSLMSVKQPCRHTHNHHSHDTQNSHDDSLLCSYTHATAHTLKTINDLALRLAILVDVPTGLQPHAHPVQNPSPEMPSPSPVELSPSPATPSPSPEVCKMIDQFAKMQINVCLWLCGGMVQLLGQRSAPISAA
jgi:hypothetical protein